MRNRIAIISDTHLTSEDRNSRSLFPRQIDSLPADQAEAVYQEIRLSIEEAYQRAMSWLNQNGPWDFLIHFGDMTGGYQEQGLGHDRAFPLAQRCWYDMGRVTERVRVCLGNHDLGYQHIGSLKDGGLSEKSIRRAKELFGDVYWHEFVGGLHIIGVCSSFAEYSGNNPFILEEKKAQEGFLSETLWYCADEPWVLCAHEPRTLGDLAEIIHPHLHTLEHFLYGDLHNPFWGKLKRVTAFVQPPTKKGSVVAAGLLRSIMCPSTAPLWWKGHQLLALDAEKGVITPEYVQLHIPAGVERIPTASLWKCLLWMIKPRH